MRFTSQTLLFPETKPVASLKDEALEVPASFYEKGYAVLDAIETPEEALQRLETMIASIDDTKLPLLSSFLSRLQLAKADAIPVCEDIVSSSYQVLHFDMGQPLIAKHPQTMYFVTALYAPLDEKQRTAKTRILPLKGLLSDERFGGSDGLKKRVTQYVEKYGDGWDEVNTYRLASFARFLDAASGTEELAAEKNRTVGHWYHDQGRYSVEESTKNEADFYAQRGVNLSDHEEHIQLQPGQMLFFDNTRVVHGRVGNRKARELYQFLLGVETVEPQDIQRFVDHLVGLLTV